MGDIFSSSKRSEIMAKVKGRGNQSTEIRLIEIFKEAKITGWRRHPRLIGKPDFLFQHARVAVFVDGCFWHGCSLHGSVPHNNRQFWRTKLERNKARDRLVNKELKKRGWSILRIWQHDLKKPALVVRKVNRLLNQN